MVRQHLQLLKGNTFQKDSGFLFVYKRKNATRYIQKHHSLGESIYKFFIMSTPTFQQKLFP